MPTDPLDPDSPDPASPPCYARELEAGYGADAPTPRSAEEIAAWRKSERRRLIAARLAYPAREQARLAEAVARDLDALLLDHPGRAVSGYWPYRGEIDLRPWLERQAAQGRRTALPVVVEKNAPLEFRSWRAGAPLERGVLGILFPRDGAPIRPEIVLAPLVGFDPACYRLGYGGGYFDRTLAALLTSEAAPRPLVIGVGAPGCQIPTIHPQPHDIPMDVIVTGDGKPRRRG